MSISITTVGGSFDRNEYGRWMSGCPECGSEIRLKNLTNRKVGGSETCENCRDWITDPLPPFNLTGPVDDPPSVVDEMGACGCGSPYLVDQSMFTYLKGVKTYRDEVGSVPFGTFDYVTKSPKSPYFPYGLEESHAYLLAYVADMLGWTEHGMSVGGAWLTDDGEEALAVLQARQESEMES